MSSIYKKGRDGYFYYQAYVLDPSTGKKNKRVYHSLGTKNENTAKNLQIKYDEKYSTNRLKMSSNFLLLSAKFKWLGSSVLLIMVIYSLFSDFNTAPNGQPILVPTYNQTPKPTLNKEISIKKFDSI